ncbi:MAG TPA: hypothetical protein VFM90_13025, partial [Cyclobacteriaceae bacterium]|nr:hypothetical protein [Cyclobacteriaceae bacterium]
MYLKKLLPVVFTFISLAAVSQSIQQEINDQVWKPFTKAIVSQDVEEFIRLHSNDVMRVERNSGHIMNYGQYKNDLEKSWPAWKQSMQVEKNKYIFELRFLERLAKDNQAYEVGYFKNEIIHASGEKRIRYGQFHVALRK